MPFFLLLTSCLSSFDYDVEYRIDPLVKSYVDDFRVEAESRGIELDWTNLILEVAPANRGQFKMEGKDILGLTKHIGPQVYVYIDEGLLNSPCELEGVIFHELGHALLNREHISSRSSYMNLEFMNYRYRLGTCVPIGAPVIITDLPSREELLDELIN